MDNPLGAAWAGVNGVVRLRVIGPMEALDGDVPVPIGPPKHRLLLAVLVTRVGRTVPTAELVDALWDDAPPPSAAVNLRSYIHGLRRVLGAQAVTGHGRPGYALAVAADDLDVTEFARLAREGEAALVSGRAGCARDLLHRALALWRGPPYEGLDHAPALLVHAAELQERRLAALDRRIEADLRCRAGGELVVELTDLIAQYPYRERFHAHLMTALYRDGRQAEALAAYRAARAVLTEDLGVEPGAELRRLEAAILGGDPCEELWQPPEGARQVVRAGAGTAGAPAPVRVPAELPLDVPGFTGRKAELAKLDGVLTAAGGHPTAVAVAVVAGTAGVGKTALVVHWAHRVRDRFPDGQLFANLHGFDRTGTVLAPVDALGGFLAALDVPPPRIPADLAGRAALFRSVLADRRVLVVLDNAADADAVRPLLPGAPGCLVLTTSRSSLPGLIAGAGARLLDLDLLSSAEARELLAHRVDAERLRADPAAVDSIVTACARLPLALTIAASRAATRPQQPLARLAEELRDARVGLDAFADGDEATDVRTVLSWSYRALDAPAARLFRLVGLHTGPDFAVAAAASLAGVNVVEGRRLLRALTGAHLLVEHRHGRYTFHYLLRAYATERVRADESEPERRAAIGRMLAHYLHSAHAAERWLHPQRDPIVLDPAPPGVVVEEFPDADGAMAWFAAEHRVLLAAVRHAYEAGLDAFAWQLAWTLTIYLDRQGHWHAWADSQRTALAAAQRAGDPAGRAFAHRNIGLALAQLGEHDDADRHLRTALDLYAELRDAAGQAHALNSLARMHGSRGRYRAALDETRLASDLFGVAGHSAGRARALNNVGWYHALLGEHEQALTQCKEALHLHQTIGDRYGEANTWDSLGYVHHQRKHHSEAVTSYRTALDLWRTLGDRYHEADTLTRLGETYAASGHADAARTAWKGALNILVELGHPDADGVRTKLGPTKPDPCRTDAVAER